MDGPLPQAWLEFGDGRIQCERGDQCFAAKEVEKIYSLMMYESTSMSKSTFNLLLINPYRY